MSMSQTRNGSSAAGPYYIGTPKTPETSIQYLEVSDHFLHRLPARDHLYFERDVARDILEAGEESPPSDVGQYPAATSTSRFTEVFDDEGDTELPGGDSPSRTNTKPNPSFTPTSLSNRAISHLMIHIPEPFDRLAGLTEPQDETGQALQETAPDGSISRKVLADTVQRFTPIESFTENDDGSMTVVADSKTFELGPGGAQIDSSGLPKSWGGGPVIDKFMWTEFNGNDTEGSGTGKAIISKDETPVDGGSDDEEDLYNVVSPYSLPYKPPPAQALTLTKEQDEEKEAWLKDMMAALATPPPST